MDRERNGGGGWKLARPLMFYPRTEFSFSLVNLNLFAGTGEWEGESSSQFIYKNCCVELLRQKNNSGDLGDRPRSSFGLEKRNCERVEKKIQRIPRATLQMDHQIEESILESTSQVLLFAHTHWPSFESYPQ